MACEGNGMSDERIGEALIKEVIEEELREEVPAEAVPPLTPLLTNQVQSQQEQKVVTELAKMIRIIGDNVKNNQLLEDAIDGIRRAPGSKWDLFKQVADKVFAQGITWERIAVLFYVAGRLAVKLVEAHLPQSVREVVQWTVDFFRTNLLGWIREHGGWVCISSHVVQSFIYKQFYQQFLGVGGRLHAHSQRVPDLRRPAHLCGRTGPRQFGHTQTHASPVTPTHRPKTRDPHPLTQTLAH
ncbi:apoptosis regulator BAX-like isoform X1 [Boleophthalmus pectinirostris]|uniref:apoptosis regulator BAX-like isoform X1 n=1 Tax=Boleophthalmus pectinirostris TaxID=150288 RepID=UPI002432FC7B|nr:apoptosis regulator BAX-like isoform X1 [Boleophthalmus pectinirostris]